jgi:hypothetical protein
MKLLLQLSLIIISTSLLAQSKKVLLQGDTLIIRDENITTNAFKFGDNTLNHLRFKPGLKKPVVEASAIANVHVPGQMDSIYTFKFKKDVFRVYKVKGVRKNFLMDATINTKRFVTKHGIKTGMKKKQIISLLSSYKIGTIPGYLVLENSEFYEYFRFKFNKRNVLKRIEFQGYFD